MKTFHTENHKSAHVLYCWSKNEQKSPNQTNKTKIKTLFLTVCVSADYILCSSSSSPNKTNKKIVVFNRLRV